MPREIIGIDPGSYSVKLTRISSFFGRFEITAMKEWRRAEPLPPLSPDPLLAEALREFLGGKDLGAVFSVGVIPGDRATSRIITLPFTNARKIDETIAYEIENLMPVPLESLIFNYHPVAQDNSQTTLLVVAAERDTVARHLETYKLAGIEPRFLESDFTAISHLFPYLPADAPGNFLLADLGHQYTALAAARDGRLLYCRTAGVGGLAITQALEKTLKISREEAQQIKHGYNFFAPSEEIKPEVRQAVRAEALGMVSELRQTLQKLRSDLGVEPEVIYLTGGGARLQGLSAFIEEQLGLPTTRLVLDRNKIALPESQENPPETYPVTLGLALRGLDQNREFRVNFRQAELAYQSVREESRRQLKQIGVLTLILLVLLGVNVFYRGTLEKHRYQTIHRQVREVFTRTFPDVKQIVDEPAQMRTKIAEEKERMQILGGMGGGLTTLDILGELSSRIPKELTIDIANLTVDPQKVMVEAGTSSYEAVDKIKARLQESDIFAGVNVYDSKTGANSNVVNFKMTIDIRQ